MKVLVDTSVWIDYFRGRKSVDFFDGLLDQGLVCTNEIILLELLPFLRKKDQHDLADLLLDLPCLDLGVDWDELREIQVQNLSDGTNSVGIPDLMIFQNAMDYGVRLYSFDKHFSLMNRDDLVDLVEGEVN